MRRTIGRALWLSVLLHVLVAWLVLVPGPGGRTAPAGKRLLVRLAPLPVALQRHPPAPPARAALPAGEARRRPEVKPDSAVAARAGASPQASAAPPVEAISGRLLGEAARDSIARESRSRMLDPMFAGEQRAAPALSPLARATARALPGEKMIGDGLVRVVSADGKVRCVQKPNDSAIRDIPVPVTAVPTNCPN